MVNQSTKTHPTQANAPTNRIGGKILLESMGRHTMLPQMESHHRVVVSSFHNHSDQDRKGQDGNE
jgi:hypothetical protein